MSYSKATIRNKKIVSQLILASDISKNLENKVQLLELAARIESKNFTHELVDLAIEKRIAEIASITAKKVHSSSNKTSEVLHVISRCYEKGGHTKLMQHIIEADDKHIHSICIVFPHNILVPLWLEAAVKKTGGEIYKIEDKERIKKIEKIQKLINDKCRVFAYLHPWDITSAIAISSCRLKGISYFYNHADHVFNVGCFSCDYIIDMSREGAYITNRYRRKNRSIVLPIPLNELTQSTTNTKKRAEIRKSYNISLDAKVVLSIASDEKYKENNYYSFEKFVGSLLKNSLITIVLVGPNPNKPKWKKLKEKYKNRLILTGILNHEKYNDIFTIADCYVDSFPMDSATCTLDAIVRRIPTYSLYLPEAYIDELRCIKCKDIQELTYSIKNTLFQNVVYYDINSVIEKVKKNHCSPDWDHKLELVLNSPEKILENGVYIFDIEDYYFYMEKIYMGNRFVLRRDDIKVINIRNLLLLLRILKFNFLIGLINSLINNHL